MTHNTDQGRSTTAEMEERRSAPTDSAEVDEDDTAAHGVNLTNVNETVVEDAPADEQGDTEGHLAGTNVNETVVEDALGTPEEVATDTAASQHDSRTDGAARSTQVSTAS